MAMLAFSRFENSKNQFQLIRHLIHDTTLGNIITGTDQQTGMGKHRLSKSRLEKNHYQNKKKRC
jgi:hypothetical protein